MTVTSFKTSSQVEQLPLFQLLISNYIFSLTTAYKSIPKHCAGQNSNFMQYLYMEYTETS